MLIKFGSLQNMMDLYENGTIFLNTIDFFRKYEDEELRGDIYEGAGRIINSLPGTIQIPGIERPVSYLKVHVKNSHEVVLGNIYSLYCISPETIANPLEYKMDERVNGFGKYCLVVPYTKLFLEKIKTVLTANGYKFDYGLIKYYDKEKINGQPTLFQKPLEFEYQKEYRIYVESEELKPIKINIGSLKGIGEVHLTKDIVQTKFEKNKKKNQP